MSTSLLHLVGPQGCGKSTLARCIVDGLKAHGKRAVTHTAEEVHDLANEDLRSRFTGFDVAVIEAETLNARHQELAPGDAVWQFRCEG